MLTLAETDDISDGAKVVTIDITVIYLKVIKGIHTVQPLNGKERISY
jgi:hypothetical protein